MARAIWSGAISFGLVNVPVKLFSATSPKSVRFHQRASKTGARIRQKRVDPSTDEEVAYEDIVKGYEITPDHYVTIDADELDAPDPKATKTVDIEEFVSLDEIDPIFYDHPYYLAPTAGGAKAYRLLLGEPRGDGQRGREAGGEARADRHEVKERYPQEPGKGSELTAFAGTLRVRRRSPVLASGTSNDHANRSSGGHWPLPPCERARLVRH